ncbi:MAG: CapA family protein [Parcubacteria group bacterium]
MKNVKIIFLVAIIIFFSGCGKIGVINDNANNLGKEISKYPETSVEDRKSMKLLFVGDMMFDRYIRETADKRGGDYDYMFGQVKDLLASEDLVIGNLEGPITDKNSVSINTKLGESKNFNFTFAPSVAGVLTKNNIKLVNLGNNHILNQGEAGVQQTKKYLDEAGVQYFGDLETKAPIGALVSKNINGIKISFVSYNYSIPDSIETALENIKAAKTQSNIVIICPHWGTEYKVGDPGNNIRNLAYQFIDAGADFIIGTHPHVVQDSEIYKGKKIYYSLGNFIFDQYFQKETKEGLTVEVTVNPKDHSLDFRDIPIALQTNGQTKVK